MRRINSAPDRIFLSMGDCPVLMCTGVIGAGHILDLPLENEMNYLMFRLFARPILYIFGGLISYLAMAFWLPAKFAATPLFSPIGEAIRANSGVLPFALFSVGGIWFLYNLYRFWQWHEGGEPCCPRCGMMMEERKGRHGAFLGCMRYPDCRGTLDYWG
jgi:hypothetical protein